MPPTSLKDKWQGHIGHVPTQEFGAGGWKRSEGEKWNLLLASFLALALDLILSACRFLSSSSVSPEAATTLSSSHQHCQFGHLRTCAQAIQSDTLAGAKKLSNVFIIITFLSYRLPFRSLISSPPPLPPPPALSSTSHLPSLPPCHPLTHVPLLTHTPQHPLHSAPASTFSDSYTFNSDSLVCCSRRWTQWGMVESGSYQKKKIRYIYYAFYSFLPKTLIKQLLCEFCRNVVPRLMTQLICRHALCQKVLELQRLFLTLIIRMLA